ncbi:MAG: CBS domain-containing protein [Actinomycetota bacterium]
MYLILCHTTADFDALGAAVGLSRLHPGSRIVLTGGCHPTVRDFLALHRDEYPLIERRSVNPKQIRSLAVVDTQVRDRLGKAAEWLDLPNLEEIAVYDHHPDAHLDIPATSTQVESVGATTTLMVEKLIERLKTEGNTSPETAPLNRLDLTNHPLNPSPQILHPSLLTPAEATVMALGIHVDTGSLTFDHATPRDAAALAWLMAQGASQRAIAEYVDPGLSPQLQDLLTVALNELQTETLRGYTVAWVLLKTDSFVPGLSSLTSRLLDLIETDALLLGNRYRSDGEEERLTAIGRSSIPQTNLNELFQPFGGGGHARAASLTLRTPDPQRTLVQLVHQLQAQIPHPPTARDLMSSPVRTIRPETTVGEAHRILLRYGHSGLSVVDAQDQLVGIISRRDIDIALHHGFSHAPVKGYMTPQLKTIAPDTSLPEIESLMVTYDIGRLPVLEAGQLVGIVTRTDVLRELHRSGGRRQDARREKASPPLASCLSPLLQDRLTPQLWQLLDQAAQMATKHGWQLYLVGGAVRDLLLAEPDGTLKLIDIDLVVDGYHHSETQGAGMELAKSLQKLYPAARLDIHGQFQTAALLWHKDPVFDSLWVDIATARTEFYPYPAANPEVEASSIRQDLYRRDFTINALAVRLTGAGTGELLDFFGGFSDLQGRQIRVLHANSFIEDPTRIYRAVRFAVRLGFQIESSTEGYIRHAIDSGIYYRVQGENSRVPALETRLKTELKHILEAPYWKRALQLLGDLGALRCLHPTLELDESLWWQVCLLDRCLVKRKKAVVEKLEQEKGQRSLPVPVGSPLPDWQLRLEVLIAYLAPEYREKVAANLQLPEDSIQRLRQLEAAQAEVVESLPKCQLPSQVVQLLKAYELPMLILIMLHSPRWVRRRIWQYLTEWANISPVLNGHDLKGLGYKPGPQFKQILECLLAATLDGIIRDRLEAESFLAEHYPLL